jgi:hypothetical protein
MRIAAIFLALCSFAQAQIFWVASPRTTLSAPDLSKMLVTNATVLMTPAITFQASTTVNDYFYVYVPSEQAQPKQFILGQYPVAMQTNTWRVIIANKSFTAYRTFNQIGGGGEITLQIK